MSSMKKGTAKTYGKVHAREGGYKAHGNRSPKSAHRTTHAMPHKTASSMKGRTGASNSTVKNAA